MPRNRKEYNSCIVVVTSFLLDAVVVLAKTKRVTHVHDGERAVIRKVVAANNVRSVCHKPTVIICLNLQLGGHNP